ncbi:hypothetical protein FRC08_016632, partial [Ceratobasidium sp. 394]
IPGMLLLRHSRAAPGTVEKFTVSSDISGTHIKIGQSLGQSVDLGFTAQVSAMSLSAFAIYLVSNCSFLHLLDHPKQLCD